MLYPTPYKTAILKGVDLTVMETRSYPWEA